MSEGVAIETPTQEALASLHFVMSSSLLAKKDATHKMVYKDGISNVMDKAFSIALRFSNENLVGSEPLPPRTLISITFLNFSRVELNN